MLKQGSKVKLSFVKEKKQGSKGMFTQCSISVASKSPDGWIYENYSAMIFGDYDLKNGDKFIVKNFGITQNKKADKTYYNIMVFDGEVVIEEDKEVTNPPLEEINGEPLPF